MAPTNMCLCQRKENALCRGGYRFFKKGGGGGGGVETRGTKCGGVSASGPIRKAGGEPGGGVGEVLSALGPTRKPGVGGAVRFRPVTKSRGGGGGWGGAVRFRLDTKSGGGWVLSASGPIPKVGGGGGGCPIRKAERGCCPALQARYKKRGRGGGGGGGGCLAEEIL